MFENLIAVIVLIVFGILFFLEQKHIQKSSKLAIENWASSNGYTILHYETRVYRLGPFGLSGRSKNQQVFKVTLKDPCGEKKVAWVKMGGVFVGLLSDEVHVKWETPK